ncbi:MAG: hypothetical protein ACYTFU_10650 [Planctomycetota bacterium]|jgi:hypothetical protein
MNVTVTLVNLKEEGEFVVRVYQPGARETKSAKVIGKRADINGVAFDPNAEFPVLSIVVLQVDAVGEPETNKWRSMWVRGCAHIDPRFRGEFEILHPPNKYEPVFKAQISVTTDNKILKAFLQTPPSKDEDDRLNVLMKNVETEFDEYNATVDGYAGKAMAKALENIFLRRFRAGAGVLPAAYFAVLGMDDPAISADALSQLLQNATRMHQWDTQTYLEQIVKFQKEPDLRTVPKLVAIMCDVVTWVVAGVWYKGDRSYSPQTGLVEVDSFQMPTSCEIGQGDCEDVAKEIHYWATRIQKLELAEDHPLRPFVWLMRQYEFAMVTGLATSPSLQLPGTTDTGEEPDKYICHVWTAGIPRLRMAQWKGRAEEEGVTPQQRRLVEIGALTLEGTNFTTALHRPLMDYYPAEIARRLAEKKWYREAAREVLPACFRDLPYPLEAMTTLKRPETMGEQSRFYRFVISLWTQPKDDADPFDHTIFQGDKFGMTFQDFLELKEGAVLRRNFERKLTNDEMRYVLALEMPRTPLVARQIAEVVTMRLAPLPVPRRGAAPLAADFLIYRLQHMNEFTPEVASACRRLGAQAMVCPITHGGQVSIIIVVRNVQKEVSAAAVALARERMP